MGNVAFSSVCFIGLSLQYIKVNHNKGQWEQDYDIAIRNTELSSVKNFTSLKGESRTLTPKTLGKTGQKTAFLTAKIGFEDVGLDTYSI